MRYNRNIVIDGLGQEGQALLKASKVLVIGGGGLGSPALYYLAAAGIGTIGVIDYDTVDITNLQRQIIHFTEDVGKPKVVSIREKLQALNPDINIITHNERFCNNNAEALIEPYDFILDCADNYATKFLIDDICVQLHKPYCHASVVAMQGEVMTYIPGNACYRDVFGSPPDDAEAITSSQVGILGAVAGIVGSIQATEAIKYITGIGELLVNRLLIVDGRTMGFQMLRVRKE
ncbi:HesA/MoeB/ThiF family protein [Bacteroides sp. 519]|uniref:HesA/MoeB/ThiF family protein n=1 Tax=Bacteroides sp. 519 TaxID=2302937 RepID=UPI0013D22936|nr:HesA/MoeB/ThiF family protein [Bacteroides sp. 519]NDV59881.1 HesA/MoeB/ThiF family protein [Bacteroides sp. 519]